MDGCDFYRACGADFTSYDDADSYARTKADEYLCEVKIFGWAGQCFVTVATILPSGADAEVSS